MSYRFRKPRITLIELVILIAIVGVAGWFVFGLMGCTVDWQKAEKYARGYAAKVPGSTGEVSCMKKDSDNDGYCRCTIFKKNGDPLSVECGCEKYCIVCAEGCGGIKPHLQKSSTE